MFPARERGDLGVSRPEEVENAAGTRHAVCLSPAPGGVEFVMSPQLTSCQVGWRESSAGGFRHAELARREVGWILSHWARITQAGPWSPWRAWRGAGCAPPCRPGSDPTRARLAPSRNRPPRPRAVADPAPVPGPVVPARPGPRARRVTRENVPRPASTSLNPRARTSSRRARGLSDVLAGRGAQGPGPRLRLPRGGERRGRGRLEDREGHRLLRGGAQGTARSTRPRTTRPAPTRTSQTTTTP